MRPELVDNWQSASRDAREAALALNAALSEPGTLPPDELFERVRILRQRAREALRELTLDYELESSRATLSCNVQRHEIHELSLLAARLARGELDA